MLRRAVSRAGDDSALDKKASDKLESELAAFQKSWVSYDVMDDCSKEEKNTRHMSQSHPFPALIE